MGNEFGHPEWIDFPRVGNGESFQHARRQWSLCDSEHLRYRQLFLWDVAMHALEDRYQWMGSKVCYVSLQHEVDKMIVFERGNSNLLFVFNFHATNSFRDYKIGVQQPGKYKVVLSSDALEFGGQGRIDEDVQHFTNPEPFNSRSNSMMIYAPCRTCTVYALADSPMEVPRASKEGLMFLRD
jgi:1,4-alpha-glucan branching enzyme